MNSKSLYTSFAGSIAAFIVTSALFGCGENASTQTDTQAVQSTPETLTSTNKPLAGGKLNIYNWVDYIPEGMIDAFEQETGINVTYDTFENNETLHAKLIAGNTGYDIVVPSSTFAKLQLDANLFQPLRKELLPNLINLNPVFMEVLAAIDPDNAHLVTWGWGFTTVGINLKKVQSILGNTPLPANSWELVLNPTYTQKLRECGIAYLDSPTEILPVALHYVGKSAYSENPADLALAAQALAVVRPDVRFFSNTLLDDLASGQACVAIGWSGDINLANDQAVEAGISDEIVALLPEKGGLIFFDTIAIPTDAKNVAEAHAFINFFLRPDNAASMANEMHYPTGNTAALPLIDKKIAANKTIFVSDSFMQKMVPPGSFTNEIREQLNEIFTAFKRRELP